MLQRRITFSILLGLLCIYSFIVIMPRPAFAGPAEDAFCSVPNEKPPPQYKNEGKPCGTGICKSGKCQLAGGGPKPSEGMPMPPMLPMLPMLPMGGGGSPPPPPPSSDCGGSGGIASIVQVSSSSPDGSCSSSGNGGSTYFPSFDTSVFNTTGSSNSSNVADSVISSLLNGTMSPGDTQFSNSNNSGNSAAGTVTGGVTGARPLFGSVEGVSGDIQVQGGRVTILASYRDSTRGAQLSGAYGYSIAPGTTALTVFQSMCSVRPWASSFISYIVAPMYFDSLCSARGLTVGVKPVVSENTSAVSSQAAPKSSTVSRPASQAPSAVRADIWATPPSIHAGERTNIFWNSSGATSCAVTSSNSAFSGTSLIGHGTTQPLTQNTTFSIQCFSATSTASNQVIVTIQ